MGEIGERKGGRGKETIERKKRTRRQVGDRIWVHTAAIARYSGICAGKLWRKRNLCGGRELDGADSASLVRIKGLLKKLVCQTEL